MVRPFFCVRACLHKGGCYGQNLFSCRREARYFFPLLSVIEGLPAVRGAMRSVSGGFLSVSSVRFVANRRGADAVSGVNSLGRCR